MIFDKLCGLVERFLPEHKQTVENSNLFVFPGKAHEVLPKFTTDKQMERLEVFQLPFSITAVEDTASLIILQDKEEGQIGFDKSRYFIEAMPFKSKSGSEDSEFAERWQDLTGGVDPINTVSPQLRGKLERAYLVTFGYMTKMTSQGGAKMSGQVRMDRFVVLSKQDGIISDSSEHPDWEEMQHDPMVVRGAKNAITALEEILFFSSPEFFTLEARSIKEHKKAGGKKIRRSHQRPIYTMLKPTEIRNKLGLEQPEGQRGSPRPHERRAHFRRLRKESGYKEDRIVPVKACWIGPDQADVSGKRYQVRLDLFS